MDIFENIVFNIKRYYKNISNDKFTNIEEK